MTDNTPIFTGTVQLLGWSDTHTGGAKIVLALESSEDLWPFKLLTVKHGKTAGQLLGIAVVLQNDEPQEQEPPQHPPEKPKGGALARLAGMWCQREDFQGWLAANQRQLWSHESLRAASLSPPELAKLVLYALCNIDSLARLDHEAPAQVVFHDLIREPFATYLKAQGLD